MPRYRNLSLVAAWALLGVLFLTPCALAEAVTGQDAAGAEGSHATAGMLLTLLVVAIGLLAQYVVLVLVKKKQVSAAIPTALLGLVLFIVAGYIAYQETKSIVLGHGSADSPAAPVQVPAQEQTPTVLVPAGDLDPDALYLPRRSWLRAIPCGDDLLSTPIAPSVTRPMVRAKQGWRRVFATAIF